MGLKRKLIRYYARDLVKSCVNVNVFVNRPSPIFVEETPCVLIYPAAEQNDVWTGNDLNVKSYRRNLMLNTDVLVTEQLRPGENWLENEAADDVVDDLCERIEAAFGDDWFFFRLLSGYDANESGPDGLLLGSNLASSTPYNIDTEGERRIVGMRMTWNLPYEAPAYKDKKWPDFDTYYTYFMRVGYDDETVDPILRESKGTIDND